MGFLGELGHDHAQDAVLEACFDCILIDFAGEAEGTLELADGALAHPIPVLWSLLAARLDGAIFAFAALGDLSFVFVLLVRIILHGGFVRLVVDGFGRLVGFMVVVGVVA